MRLSKPERILREIPKDEWISAADIGKKIGLSSRSVGSLIGIYLLNKFVERRISPKYSGHVYEYKQLARFERTQNYEPTCQGGLLPAHEALGRNQAKTLRP